MRSRPILTFITVCVLTAAGVASYLYRANTRPPATTGIVPGATTSLAPSGHDRADGREDEGSGTNDLRGAATGGADAVVRSAPRILYRYTGVDREYGRLAISGPDGTLRFVDGFTCEVVYFAGGSGICLTADRGVFTTYAAELFDARFERRARIPLQGIPSRCRVSPDGRWAAMTVFLTGHSYSSVDFSTQTLIVDARNGTIAADLERDFVVFERGRRIQAEDFNFWGVTFAPDSRRFYCTLSTAGRHYLLEGDIRTKSAQVVHENVECPSLSPDGTRDHRVEAQEAEARAGTPGAGGGREGRGPDGAAAREPGSVWRAEVERRARPAQRRRGSRATPRIRRHQETQHLTQERQRFA